LTGICLNVNGDRAGGAYGYVGGWIGGQAEYVMVADFNLLKFLTKSKPWKDIRSNYAN
jgi:glutathione-independent formaldehyde dehydrogenase